jgi:hypothetical protein
MRMLLQGRKNQELEPVLEPLRILDFVGFQEQVLEGTLNLDKGFQNRFLRTLNLRKRVEEPVP